MGVSAIPKYHLHRSTYVTDALLKERNTPVFEPTCLLQLSENHI